MTYNVNYFFISGKVGSGKDTVAEYIINNKIDRLTHVKFAYADELKAILFHGGWNGKKDLAGRKLLQEVGGAFRKYNEDTWVNLVFDKILNVIALPTNTNHDINILITDCRYINELYGMIQKLSSLPHIGKNVNYYWIYVDGVNHDPNREMDKDTLSSQSETELAGNINSLLHSNVTKLDLGNNAILNIEYIENNGTITELYDKIDLMFKTHKELNNG